jgi:hypothetical protein
VSDDELTEEQIERRHIARRKIAEAIAEYADAFESTGGALLTGYVIAVEVSTIGAGQWFFWFTGNGADPNDDSQQGGLASHRAEGLMRRAIRDLYTGGATSG